MKATMCVVFAAALCLFALSDASVVKRATGCEVKCPTNAGTIVCGSDGKFYSNKCLIKAASYNSRGLGAGPITPSRGCSPDATEVTTFPCDFRCPWVRPVCGSDGRTYANGCKLDVKSVLDAYRNRPVVKPASKGACKEGDAVVSDEELGAALDEEEADGFIPALTDEGRVEKIESCAEVKESGIYTLATAGGSMNVFCELKDGEAWIVIQRRIDGTEDFKKDWEAYKNGFGDMEKEFWLGNENLHRLTSSGAYQLRFDMTTFDGRSLWASYDEFRVGSEGEQYALRLKEGSYQGNAGNEILHPIHSINGRKFTTVDVDNDLYKGQCSQMYHGGWWYSACHIANPNGLYGSVEYGQGIVWRKVTGFKGSLATIEMKMRPME